MQLMEIIQNTDDLPTIPATLTQILSVSNHPDSNINDLTEIVLRDQVLAGKILQVINSAMYGLHRKIDDLERAVALLGFYEIADLALSMSVFDSLYSPNRKGDPFSRENFWNHCFLVASIAKRLAVLTGLQPGNAFSAGLLHDVGKVVLDLKIPRLFIKIIEMVAATNSSFIETEIMLLGSGHSDVGQYLLKKWGLPEVLTDAVAGHHYPTTQRNPLTDIIYVANLIADACGFPSITTIPERTFESVFEEPESLQLEQEGRLPERGMLQELFAEFKEMSYGAAEMVSAFA